MYESEANNRTEEIDQIPAEILGSFQEFRSRVQSRTLLPWGEHCTECAWPTCYTTCDLYSPRPDGRCRRFLEGMVRLGCPGAVNSYLLKVRFKRWGKLWAPGNARLFSLADADRLERRDQAIASAVQLTPLPKPIKGFVTNKRYSWKKKLAEKENASTQRPNLFVVECYNPSGEEVSISLTMRPTNSDPGIAFQKLIRIPAGFHRETIPVEEISRIINLENRFSIDLTPNELTEGATLIFGAIDFVEAKEAPKKEHRHRKPTAKCVVWDLDNTLWDGILVEDGIEKLALKDGVVDIIRELDRRGILNSIASKNNFSEAMAVLKAWGIDEYFLHPQISWNPKSESIKAIAAKLNIGADTLLFVDDSPFELEQVQAACPGVQVLAAERYKELPKLEVCNVPVTAESTSRRAMYQQEAIRESTAGNFAGDYLAFLRDCQIQVQIEPLSSANLERVHELTQRTNQMNFSGRRYERAMLEQIAAAPDLDTYVISCRDRFGSYGIVGFSIVDSREPRMTDLMFSCRVQAKRVEHALLAYLLRKYIQATGSDFWADYRKTPRNAPSGRVFEDIGMKQKAERDGVTSLVFPSDRPIPDDGVLVITENRSVESLPRPVCSPSSR